MSQERETVGILSNEGGEYDLVDAPQATPKSTVDAVPTLSYAGANTPAASATPHLPSPNARGAAADPLWPRQVLWRDRLVPAGVAAVGALIYGLIGYAIAPTAVAGSIWVAVNFAFDASVLVIALLIATKLIDTSFGDIPSLTLKVAATVLGPAALHWGILWIDGGGVFGYLLAFIVSILALCALLAYLFELEANEVIVVALLNVAVEILADGIWLATLGTWGFLP